MRKLVSFMHVSLDGFVAGPQNEMNWIHVDEKIFDYAGERIKSADTALYGRVTFDLMESYWPTAADQPNPSRHDLEHSAWYKKVNKVVLSRTIEARPGIEVISEEVEKNIRSIKQRAGGEIIIFGSPSAVHSLMKFRLVDEIWVFVNPVLIGKGIPYFSGLPQKELLELAHSQTFPSGVVCLHYKFK